MPWQLRRSYPPAGTTRQASKAASLSFLQESSTSCWRKALGSYSVGHLVPRLALFSSFSLHLLTLFVSVLKPDSQFYYVTTIISPFLAKQLEKVSRTSCPYPLTSHSSCIHCSLALLSPLRQDCCCPGRCRGLVGSRVVPGLNSL